MNRPITTAVTTLFGALALATVAACSSTTAGALHGTPGPTASTSGAPSGAGSSAGASTDAAGATAADHSSGSGTGSDGSGGSGSGGSGSGGDDGSGGGSGGGRHPHAPTIARADVECVVTDHEQITGLGSVAIYSPQLSWKVEHATGMALSVDNPGLVGSYGTYGASGSLTLGSGCYQGESHTITFYTVGGSGPQAQRTVVQTGTMTRPTAPPFANSSAPESQSPSAGPSS